MANINLVTALTMSVVESIEQITIPQTDTVAVGTVARINTTNGKATPANATTSAEARVYGIKVSNQNGTGTLIRKGVVDGYDLSGMAYDDPVFLSDTDGRISTTPGTVNVVIGRVIPATSNLTGNALDKLLLVDVQEAEDVALDSLTVATGGTLAVTDADALTEGGVIVPTSLLISYPINLHASKVIHNLFVARAAYQVLNIDYTPDIAQGGALTATVVKATGTSTPASGTTPMHAAGAIDLNGAAHTVQPLTLTATTPDLVLAAGNRIAIVLSGAMTTGSGNVTIRMKRV